MSFEGKKFWPVNELMNVISQHLKIVSCWEKMKEKWLPKKHSLLKQTTPSVSQDEYVYIIKAYSHMCNHRSANVLVMLFPCVNLPTPGAWELWWQNGKDRVEKVYQLLKKCSPWKRHLVARPLHVAILKAKCQGDHFLTTWRCDRQSKNDLAWLVITAIEIKN